MIDTRYELACQNLYEYWRLLSLLPPGKYEEDAYRIQVTTPMHSSLLNPVFLRKERDVNALQNLDGLIPRSLWLDDRRHHHLKSVMMRKYQCIMPDVKLMMMELDKDYQPVNSDDFTIVRCHDNKDLNDWIEPIKVAFQFSDVVAAQYQSAFENVAENFIHYMALKDDKCVASASLMLSKKYGAGFYNLGVLPAYRNQGIATALKYQRLHDARARGYRYASLQATTMGAGIDLSIGFETLSLISVFSFN